MLFPFCHLARILFCVTEKLTCEQYIKFIINGIMYDYVLSPSLLRRNEETRIVKIHKYFIYTA